MKLFKILLINMLLFISFSINVSAEFGINVYIEGSDTILDIDVEATDTIKEVQTKIEELTGINLEYQTLTYKDTNLLPENTVQDSCITPKDNNVKLKVSEEYKVILDVAEGNIIITNEYYQIADNKYQYAPTQYTIIGESTNTNITINNISNAQIIFDDMQIKYNVPWEECNNYISLNNSSIELVIRGDNTLQAHQDRQNAPALIMDESSMIKINGDGKLTIHGGSNYHGGSSAVQGGNLSIESGTLNLIGGNKVTNNYGRSFDGISIEVLGGNLNCYQGTIDAKNVGEIIAENYYYTSGLLNGITLDTKPTIGDYQVVNCDEIIFDLEDYAYYKLNDGEWKQTNFFNDLSVGQVYEFTKKYVIPSLNYYSEISDPVEIVINHKYTNHISDAIAKEASCLEPAEYYLLCDECGHIGEQTLAYGDALGHLLADKWSYDQTDHWKICERCHEKLEDTISEHILQEVIIKEPTIYETGLKCYECPICGYRSTNIIMPKISYDMTEKFINENVFESAISESFANSDASIERPKAIEKENDDIMDDSNATIKNTEEKNIDNEVDAVKDQILKNQTRNNYMLLIPLFVVFVTILLIYKKHRNSL